LRALVSVAFVALAACGSQKAPTQTQTPTPSQTQAPAPTASQAVTPAPTASQTLAATPTACKANDDCAMSNLGDCCLPCSLPPFAGLKSAVDGLASRCARVHCSTREPQECKPTESLDVYHAECQHDACVAVRNPPAQTPIAPALLTSTAGCSRDGDCTVSNFAGCCSACQASAYATSNRELTARNRVCAIVDCTVDGRFKCEPIVDASLYRATCRAGTCAGVKR
jgi:hypothetical protein